MKATAVTIALLLFPILLHGATLHLKTGVEIDGRKVGRDGSTVYIETETNTLRFPAHDVDIGKTFPQNGKGDRKDGSIPAPPKGKREKSPAVRPAPDKPVRPAYVKHLDSRAGYEVTYPGSWLKMPPGDKLLFLKSFQDKTTFSVAKNRTTLSTESFKQYMKSTGAPDFMKDVRKQFPDSYLVEATEGSLGGREAIRITYVYRPTSVDAQYTMAATRIICIHDKDLFIVFHETPMSLYRANSHDLEKLIASFNFR